MGFLGIQIGSCRLGVGTVPNDGAPVLYLGPSGFYLGGVGERDIDIPQADLLIVYDVVNTVKTMYQRMKRTRGGTVLTLCYRDTFEEKKVNRLLSEIAKRYPWSSIIK